MAESEFDWNLRPLFLRFNPDNSAVDRQAAFQELCRMCNMTLDASDWTG